LIRLGASFRNFIGHSEAAYITYSVSDAAPEAKGIMSQPDDASGLNPFHPPADAPAQDGLDQALSDILGKDNPRAVPILNAIQRTLHQYHLEEQYEAYEILHEAYLRGKKKLQTGEIIRSPYAWLRATAFHVIYERQRKHRASATDPQVMEAVLPDPGLHPMQQQQLNEELDQLYRALHLLHQEDPEGTCLLYLRNVRSLSWSQISHWLAAQGQPVPTAVTLRQRASRAKRRLRAIAIAPPRSTSLGLPGRAMASPTAKTS
jgi:predicted RNA polymerase sigma factor